LWNGSVAIQASKATTATGTHGSGDRNGILSTAVSAVDLVKADGWLVTVDRSNPDLKALAVGLGGFGIITEWCSTSSPPNWSARTSTATPRGTPCWRRSMW
jgi:hypothetical protein